jgi:hypothetical protein
MTDAYLIRNQHGHYWGKSKEWVSGAEAKAVLRTKHEDEAINTLFELSAKDVELRGEVIAAELGEKGEPIIEASQVPLPGLEGDNPEVMEPGSPERVEPVELATPEAP